MSETTTQRAIDLMPQLRDILHLPEDQDLPALWAITFSAHHGASGWRVSAQLDSRQLSDLEQWEALKAWGPGGALVLGEPTSATARMYPSGSYRRATVTVEVAGVSVEVWAHVDAGFIPPGWCCADSYRAQGPCADCVAGPVADVHEPKPEGPFPSLADHEARRSRGWLVAG